MRNYKIPDILGGIRGFLFNKIRFLSVFGRIKLEILRFYRSLDV
jgi:hypothetical protein